MFGWGFGIGGSVVGLLCMNHMKNNLIGVEHKQIYVKHKRSEVARVWPFEFHKYYIYDENDNIYSIKRDWIYTLLNPKRNWDEIKLGHRYHICCALRPSHPLIPEEKLLGECNKPLAFDKNIIDYYAIVMPQSGSPQITFD